MNLLMDNSGGTWILVLLILFFLFWATPFVMLIVGLTRLKSRPKNAKTLIIISGIWLVIGAGACGSMMI